MMCITQTAATIAQLLGFSLGTQAAEPLGPVLRKAQEKFGVNRCSRVLMYNPDAVGLWVFNSHKDMFRSVTETADVKLRLRSVFPPVTPVCFASMYSGLEPEQHGIVRYEKPVLRVATVFDEALKAGKKAAIVSTRGDSISEIFLNRPLDYYIYKSPAECNQRAMELIKEDRYDLIVLYNGNYDYYMHRCGPEGRMALRALRQNIDTYCRLREQMAECWKEHDSVLVFAPDHGCHRQFVLLGGHGIDRPCDMEIPHFYSMLRRSQ